MYHNKQAELLVEEGCLLWRGRVIIPHSLKQKILTDLHREHLRCSKIKALVRSHVWWKGMDQDLDLLVKNCSVCDAVKQAPPKAPLHPWTMVQSTLAENTYRFCWSVHGEDVFSSGGRTIEVGRSLRDEPDNYS